MFSIATNITSVKIELIFINVLLLFVYCAPITKINRDPIIVNNYGINIEGYTILSHGVNIVLRKKIIKNCEINFQVTPICYADLGGFGGNAHKVGVQGKFVLKDKIKLMGSKLAEEKTFNYAESFKRLVLTYQ